MGPWARTLQASGSSPRAPPPALALSSSSRAMGGHFAHTATHKALMEQPQLLDLRFSHAPSVRLPHAVSITSGTSRLEAAHGGGGSGWASKGNSLSGGVGPGPSSTGGSFSGQLPTSRGSGSLPRPAGLSSPLANSPLGLIQSVPLSPARGRADGEGVLPQLRYEGGSVANGAAKQPMGVKLGLKP
jgi:hypothetical protein